MTRWQGKLNQPSNTNGTNNMTDKPNPMSRHFHEDWHDNRFDDIMYTEKQTAELRGEIQEQSEWLKDNADICLADKAEQAMSRSEARAWKYEEQQSYRK